MIKFDFHNKFGISPWAKASSTSPPTPARQSCGVWVGVEPAEVERMGMGMEQPAPWLGEEWGEPPDWDWKVIKILKNN